MINREIQTRLIKKVAKRNRVCTSCNREISINEVFYLEEGVNEHLHSLLARNFCSDCYAKYGQQILLRGDKK